jgi:hypothetical protein
MPIHKKPYDLPKEEREFFEKTSKYEMYYMLRDYAMRIQGEQETDDNPTLIIKEISDCKKILKWNKII